MKFFRRLINSSNFWPLLIVIVLTLLAGRYLFLPGYFNMHDDLQMMRQLEMEKCFLDWQIPCRWVPDMGYGFGFPLFNFYPPLPYLVGQLVRVIGFSFVDTVKVVFLLSFVVSGITMYFLAKEFFGKWGGVLSAAFYIWAPYHSVDVYVRGAMNEAWALSWFPLILYTSYKLIAEKPGKKWIIGLSLSWVALFLSHNLMVLIFSPIFALWLLFLLYKNKAWQKIPKIFLSGVYALFLSAFFTLPSALEQKYVQVDTLVRGYYEYIAHFASLPQLLISRFWGYGPSVWMDADLMPFQIGYAHWILSLITLGVVVWVIKKKKKERTTALMVLGFILIGWLTLFMAHYRSVFIWKVLPPLKFVQFPWRFLTLSTLCFSFVAGYLVTVCKGKIGKMILIILVGVLLATNWNYFKPEKMGPLTDQEKFTAAAWELQQTAGIFDYLPVGAVTAPKEPQRYLAEIMDGKGEITEAKQGTKWGTFKIEVASEKAVVRIGIFDFPIWETFIDGAKTKTYIAEKEQWGRMYLDVSSGNHEVTLKLRSTPLRLFANYLSLVAWLFLPFFVVSKKFK